MLKKTIIYTDLDGNPITEDFYFRLNKAEVAELELSHEGGLQTYLKEIIASKDGRAVIDKFKEIILLAVGRRSEDGRRFVKNQEIADDFLQTNAYSELFMELVTDADAATDFIKGILPPELSERTEKLTDLDTVEPVWPDPSNEPESEDVEEDVAPWVKEDREPTARELQEMTKEQMLAVFARREARKRDRE